MTNLFCRSSAPHLSAWQLQHKKQSHVSHVHSLDILYLTKPRLWCKCIKKGINSCISTFSSHHFLRWNHFLFSFLKTFVSPRLSLKTSLLLRTQGLKSFRTFNIYTVSEQRLLHAAPPKNTLSLRIHGEIVAGLKPPHDESSHQPVWKPWGS